jgi:uncharacterized protein (DUF2141 family)
MRPICRALLMTMLAGGVASAWVQNPAAGSIRGTAKDSTGASAGGVVVVVFPEDETRWSGPDRASVVKRVPITAGRFAVSDLAPGNWLLAFATEAMLTDWPDPAILARLKARKPMRITLAPGQQVGVDATLTISESDVVVKDAMMLQSRPELVRSGTTPGGRTGLPPAAGSAGAAPPPAAPGVISGRVTDADGKPLAGIQVRSMRRAVNPNGQVQFINSGASARTDADGRYRLTNRTPDEYVVLAEAYSIDLATGTTSRDVPSASPGTDGAMAGNLTTFHGGVTDQRAASIVRVARDEVADINIQLARRPVFNVTGSIPGLPLTSMQFWVVLMPLESREQLSTLNVRRIAITDNGTFSITEVPDGEYLLSFNSPSGWAETPMRVAGRSPDAVVLTLRPPTTFKGRVEFRGSIAAPTIVRDVREFAVELAPAQRTIGSSMIRTVIQPDGTFTATVSGPGPFQVRGLAPAPWIQASGIANGADTLDLPVAADKGIEDTLVIFTDRPSALLVRVKDAADQPLIGAGVIVFSEEPQYWSSRSRRVQLGQTTSGGTATFSNLPPGRYFVVAGRDIAPNAAITPDFVAALKARAIPFEMIAGESKSVDVRPRPPALACLPTHSGALLERCS